MTATPDLNERDVDLVRRFQAGEDRAFDELVQAHRREIYRLAYRLLGNHADADDLTQDAFVRVYRSLARFRKESSFRTWMTRIVLNLAADRRSERTAKRLVSLEEVPLKELGVETGPAARLLPFAERAVQRAVGVTAPQLSLPRPPPLAGQLVRQPSIRWDVSQAEPDPVLVRVQPDHPDPHACHRRNPHLHLPRHRSRAQAQHLLHHH